MAAEVGVRVQKDGSGKERGLISLDEGGAARRSGKGRARPGNFSLSTGISIPDYHRFYSEPVESFQPDYTPFPDGSLIARPFLNNVTASYGLLLFIGALMMLFLRNVIVSADYIRRGRVRYKTLFYVLLISQVMGFVTFVLAATTYFVDNVNCKL